MILVTGATGLVGSHVLIELTKRGEKIRALKRKPSDLSIVKNLFDFYLSEKAAEKFNEIEWCDGDLLDLVSLEKAMLGCNKVFHCAALVSFKKKDFSKLININKRGTTNIVNTCLALNVKELCYVSSTAALGRDESKSYYNESNKWTTSLQNSGYAVSKYSAENEVWRGAEEGLNVVIVNPSVILGPGDWNLGSLTIFNSVYKGLRFYTNGVNGFVDARDVAYCLAELSEQKIYKERFILVSENISFKNLFESMAKYFQVKPPSIEAKPWMAAIVWRIEGLLSFLFGKKQNITKETARSAMSTNIYSNEKIKTRLKFEFCPIDESVKNAISFFSKHFF